MNKKILIPLTVVLATSRALQLDKISNSRVRGYYSKSAKSNESPPVNADNSKSGGRLALLWGSSITPQEIEEDLNRLFYEEGRELGSSHSYSRSHSRSKSHKHRKSHSRSHSGSGSGSHSGSSSDSSDGSHTDDSVAAIDDDTFDSDGNGVIVASPPSSTDDPMIVLGFNAVNNAQEEVENTDEAPVVDLGKNTAPNDETTEEDLVEDNESETTLDSAETTSEMNAIEEKETTSEPETESGTKTDFDVTIQTEPEPNVGTEVEIEVETETEAEVTIEPETEPEASIETGSESAVDTTPEATSDNTATEEEKLSQPAPETETPIEEVEIVEETKQDTSSIPDPETQTENTQVETIIESQPKPTLRSCSKDYKILAVEEISFSYAVETTTTYSDELVAPLKETIFNSVADAVMKCSSVRRRSLRQTQRASPHLNIVSIESAPKDTVSNNETCETNSSKATTCTVINGKLILGLDDDEINHARTETLKFIKKSMDNGMFASPNIPEVVKITYLGPDIEGEEAKIISYAVEEPEATSSNTPFIIGMTAAIVFAIMFAFMSCKFCNRQKRKEPLIVLNEETDEKKEDKISTSEVGNETASDASGDELEIESSEEKKNRSGTLSEIEI